MCRRPTALQDRISDEDDLRDRDYDVAILANTLSQAFGYKWNDDNKEVCSVTFHNTTLHSACLLYLFFYYY